MDFVEQINDERELKGFLGSLKSDHEWYERGRDKNEKYGRVLEMRIPTHSGHSFRSMAATDSDASRPPVPIDSGRSFRSNPATL